MRKLFLYLLVIPCFAQAQTDYAQYVNPFIGTGGHGHTFPGATVPFGMVQLSPDTRIDGSWDGCSGYHYSDNTIYGFSHTHLSGTGCSDYGDIALLPLDKIPATASFDYKNFGVKFNHTNESAKAGYYKVQLDNNILTELTATTRAGYHRYTFTGKEAGLLLKLTHRDKTLESHVKMVDNTHIEGMRRSEAWARDQHIYFVMEFSSPCKQTIGSSSASITDYALYTFPELKGKQLLVKVGISNVSIEGARQNLEEETGNLDFDAAKSQAYVQWNTELSKIEVSSVDHDKLNVFYTALYHCMIHPGTASDVNGQYRGRDNKIYTAKDFTYYTVFSLWDTFRALHPLLAIIDKKRTSDFIKTFLAQYQQAKVLPVWELSSNETWCMIGYHSVSVIADARAKGITDFDQALALEAMQASANFNQFGIDKYAQKGFLEKEDEHESVSKTLEYAYDDWCIASFAEAQGKKEIAGKYYQRSLSWRNLFEAKTGFIRPRSNGGWMEPFEPREVNNNYTEANAWQYNFFVPHDITGMINQYGNASALADKLDALFTADSKTLGRDQSDISGLIGQYAHGNEPSHHMAYLYDYAGQPWKTQERVHQVVNEFYKNAPDGLIGNEDCGQMSAWYVFSAMGFYPVCPGNTQYAIGTPAFEKIVIHTGNENSFTITAKGLDDKAFYIENLEKLYFDHDMIVKGEKMDWIMTAKPTGKETVSQALCPSTAVNLPFVPAPLVTVPSKTFRDSTLVKIMTYGPYKIKYFTEAGNKWQPSKEPYFTKPFFVNRSVKLMVVAEDEKGNKSAPVYASLHKIPNNWSVKINATYNPQYTAGGDQGIIDGLKGDENWRKGGWQGYQSQDFECVVDLKKETTILSIHARFLQDQRSWIIMPVKVEYSYSADGVNWKTYKTVDNSIDPKDEKTQIKDFAATAAPQKARYIKVKAINFGKLPEWHVGYGMGDAFIFIDEISVN